MKKKKVKLTGKEQAKLNKRKLFYERFERHCLKLSRKSDSAQIIVIRMNKGYSFPEYDELSLLFQEGSINYESEIDEKISSIEIVYYEEAHFLLQAAKLEYLVIFRKETFVDNDGNERRGQTGSDESYDYQKAFNWGVEIKDMKKLLPFIAKEKEEPTEYDLTPEMAKIQEPVYRKAWRLPRKRRG